MSNQSKELATRVNELRFHVVDAEVRLHNTFNEFNMLADNQFIENRVYEDDDDDDDDEKKGEEKEVKEEDPLVLMKEAYNSGIIAMRYFYLDNEEDGVDDEEKSEDFYNSQPLPYVIGTKNYEESRDVGLGGYSDEESEEDDLSEEEGENFDDGGSYGGLYDDDNGGGGGGEDLADLGDVSTYQTMLKNRLPEGIQFYFP